MGDKLDRLEINNNMAIKEERKVDNFFSYSIW
jgi:hypothetical protein